VVVDAVHEGQLGAGDDEVDAVGEGKGDEVVVGDVGGVFRAGRARISRADIDVVDELGGRKTGGEGVFSAASAKEEDGEHERGNLRMGYDLHNPAGPPFYRNLHLLPPSRSRNNSQSTPDNVDLLDLTDPWGTSWHHTSPYDFGIRPRRASTPAVSTSIPHSTSALPNIHLPRKLSKRHRPQPTKHISVLSRLVRTLSHMRRSFTPHRPDPTPPPPPTAIHSDAASFVSVGAPFSIGKLTIANPDDPEPPSPAPPLPAKDDRLSSIPFPDRPASYLSYADTPMSGISVLANPPTPCARVIDDHTRVMEWEERDQERREREEKEREERDRRDREERDRREREERDRREKEERDRREERDRKDREERDRREKERKIREEKDKREREERDKREKERKDREERDRKEKERKVREERDRKERDRKIREERDRKEQERRDHEERERREKERRAHEERERKIREEKDRERKDREDRERKNREDRERKDREDRERKDHEERERKDHEERERKDREEKERNDREEKERNDREEKERNDREEKERNDREEKERNDREKERMDREERERKRREEKERNDRERAREERKKREAKRKEDRKAKDEERDQRKSEEKKSKEKDRKDRSQGKDRHERHRDDRPREKSTRKERKDRPNLNKPTPPPPLLSSSNSSFSTEPQRQSSTSARPASQLASAADLNALRAKEVWEMERLWKARSVYGTHGAVSPAGGTINGSSSTVGVEARAQVPMGINLGPGTFNGLHGSSHTAFAVHKNPHADPFPHQHQHRLGGGGGTYLPPIATAGMNEVCPSPATIPSLHDSLVSYEIPNNTSSTLVINGPYQYGVYHGLYGGSSPGLMGSTAGVSGSSSGIIVEDGHHPPHQDLLTFATNPLPVPPRESTYEPAQLTSDYWIKRSSELTSSV